jgi:hypothetical protein
MNEPKFFAAKGPIAAWLKFVGHHAITLPPFGIFIRPDHIDDAYLRRHESVHWEQAKEIGVIMFYIKYLYFQVRYGYQDNPMEIEARKAE